MSDSPKTQGGKLQYLDLSTIIYSSYQGCPWFSARGQRKWKPTPVFLPGKSHGQRSLMGYSLLGRKRVGTTVQKGSLFSILFPAFIVCRFFDADHSDWCEVIPHCSFSDHLKFYLFNFWLCWVFIVALSLVTASESYSDCSDQASHCGGFSCCRAWTLENRLSNCSSCAQLPCSTWGLPEAETEPVSPPLVGRFSTSGPPGKSVWPLLCLLSPHPPDFYYNPLFLGRSSPVLIN